MSIDRDIVTLQCQYIMTMFLISVMPCILHGGSNSGCMYWNVLMLKLCIFLNNYNQQKKKSWSQWCGQNFICL